MVSDTLYHRLGGYDAVVAVVDDLLARLKADAQLGRFWQHRGEDGVLRERQLLINFLCSSAGGPLTPSAAREVAGDGSYGGLYQRPDEDTSRLWEVGVAEVRELLDSGWAG